MIYEHKTIATALSTSTGYHDMVGTTSIIFIIIFKPPVSLTPSEQIPSLAYAGLPSLIGNSFPC